MSTPANDHSSEREMTARRLQAAGLDSTQVERALTGMFGSNHPRTTAEAVEAALPQLRRHLPGSYPTYAPYLRLLIDGLPDLCSCSCPACSTRTCPSHDTGHHLSCNPPAGPAHDCAERYTGLASRTVATIDATDIDKAGWWCERLGLKRTIRYDVAREQDGRVRHPQTAATHAKL